MVDTTATAPAVRTLPRRNNFLLATWSLFYREVLRFLRQRNRVMGSIGTPLLFWAMLGSGFGESLRPPGMEGALDYRTFFFPGTVMLVVLFTAIFSSISVIQDRNEGFLQGVVVAPVPRISIVLGKVLGGATLGLLQGLVLLLLAPLMGLPFSALGLLQGAAIVLLTAIGMSALGFAFAWRTDSVQGFHAVMNLLLMPMWLLSGALFPVEGAAQWIRYVMMANPLHYGVNALRQVQHGVPMEAFPWNETVVLGCFALVTVLLGVWLAGRPEKS